MSIPDKIKTLRKYELPSVELFGIFDVDVASENILELVYKLGEEGREGVVIKDPEMKLDPIKYTSSQAHIGELKYGFTYPFDFGRDFFFSRVIREGFQAYESEESEEEIMDRAHKIGESILLPLLNSIKNVARDRYVSEDMVIQVDSLKEAEEFVNHLKDLGVVAKVFHYNDGKAVIRRLYQSTNDRIINFLRGGLY